MVATRSKVHPPTPETTGLPVEEGESGEKVGLRRMFALIWKRRMNPAKLPNESFGAKTGHLDGTTALAVGLHFKKDRL
ncbi:MAG TPA: hypothetical protein DD723_06080 [Candidatus Omnitrophica bacterium]|nr:MAG: hypothetical protein A2Z81_06695 [Omnitrophica WOR_2 bacterium GWA2_45_18]HBR15093.1 hypothetical protein [Candidatus Omnitrophota bacterium]